MSLMKKERRRRKKKNEIALTVIAPWTRTAIVKIMSLNFDLLLLLKLKIWVQVTDFSVCILFMLQNIKK